MDIWTENKMFYGFWQQDVIWILCCCLCMCYVRCGRLKVVLLVKDICCLPVVTMCHHSGCEHSLTHVRCNHRAMKFAMILFHQYFVITVSLPIELSSDRLYPSSFWFSISCIWISSFWNWTFVPFAAKVPDIIFLPHCCCSLSTTAPPHEHD